jgi:hypothetical protein
MAFLSQGPTPWQGASFLTSTAQKSPWVKKTENPTSPLEKWDFDI